MSNSKKIYTSGTPTNAIWEIRETDKHTLVKITFLTDGAPQKKRKRLNLRNKFYDPDRKHGFFVQYNEMDCTVFFFQLLKSDIPELMPSDTIRQDLDNYSKSLKVVLDYFLREEHHLPENDVITIGLGEVLAQVKKLAHSKIDKLSILIQGATGVGKELIAHSIHQSKYGNSSKHPFISVNCGGIVETLLKSELFGHERGSFTGASDQHIGYFEQAHGGTIFLDEIADLPMSVQVAILRAIANQEISRVGGKEVIKVNVQVISATHKDLKKQVQKKLFREDLYHRLSTYVIHIPSLKDRIEAIPYFIKNISGNLEWDMESMLAMCLFDWPGNIRQLENFVIRALVDCENIVYPKDLASEVKGHYTKIVEQLKPDIFNELISLASKTLVQARTRDDLHDFLQQKVGEFQQFLFQKGCVKNDSKTRAIKDCGGLLKLCYAGNTEIILRFVLEKLKAKPGLSYNGNNENPYEMVDRFFGINYDSWRKSEK